MSSATLVAEAWVAQAKASMARGNVSFDGPEFKSYSRVIAVRYTHFVLVTNHYHSRTTSRHRSAAVAAANKAGLRLMFVPYPQINGLNAHRYNHDYLIDILKAAESNFTRYGNEASYPNYREEFNKAKANLDEYEQRFGYGREKVAA